MPDKYKSIWLSHSSINDFLSCRRLYYIKNVFKDPITKRKINITSPYLTLGIAVHKVIEDLKNIKSEKIALIEAINNQDKDFKEFLGAELQKLIKNKESISEWQNYIKLAKNKEKDILKAIIDHVMQ